MLVSKPLVHPTPHLPAQLLQLADHPLPLSLPIPGLAAVVRQAQEVEHLRTCPALAPTVLFSKPSELDQPRLVFMKPTGLL